MYQRGGKVKAVKDFYENLYKDKQKPEYKEEYKKRSKDFLHQCILFFLDPYKNTRHEVVSKILPSGERYLDIGCWTGDSTVAYRASEKFKEIYGVELCEEAAVEARNKGINVSICDINYEKLPYSDDYFDGITFVAVIEHLISPDHILEEVRRVLKPKGTLIIGTANVASLSNRIRVIRGNRPRTSFDIGWDGGHLLYFTPNELKGLLEQYSFEVVEKFATGNLQFLERRPKLKNLP